MAFKFEFADRRRPKSHRGWLFLVLVGYCFFAALKFFLQMEDPWPFFTLLLILLGLSLGAYSFAHRTNDLYYHGIPEKGVILLSENGMEIRGENGAKRNLDWNAFAHIVFEPRRKTLTFFPENSLSFEFSVPEISNIEELKSEIARFYSITLDSGLPIANSGD